MTEINQFGSLKPAGTSDPQACAACEAMLTDVIDGTLSPEERTAFDLHVAGCPSCRDMLADAERGAAWLEMLRGHRPQPSATLVGRILAQTSSQTSGNEAETALGPGQNQSSAMVSAAGGAAMFVTGTAAVGTAGSGLAGYAPGRDTGRVLPFSRRVTERMRPWGHALLQPRLAMTAAMAFFSVALTLDLTGVRLRDLRANDLKPSSLKRSFYTANAHVARYCDNLRAVYELESRVHDLQRSSEEDTPSMQAPAIRQNGTGLDDGTEGGAGQRGGAVPKDGSEKEQTAPPRQPPGTSRREMLGTGQRVVAMSPGVPEGSRGIAERFAVLVVKVSKEGGLA